MNPTEQLVEDLLNILNCYEEKTGVHVQRINIDHVPENDIGELRTSQRTVEIKLEMI